MAHLPYDEFMKMWKKKPMAVTDCIVVKNSKILLVKRATPPFHDVWSLVGGMMEVGETIEETAIRELREETGIEAKIIALVGVYSGGKRDPRGTTMSAAFLMKPVKFGKRHDKEISEMRFFSKDEIPKKLAFDHEQMISDALKIMSQNKK